MVPDPLCHLSPNRCYLSSLWCLLIRGKFPFMFYTPGVVSHLQLLLRVWKWYSVWALPSFKSPVTIYSNVIWRAWLRWASLCTWLWPLLLVNTPVCLQFLQREMPLIVDQDPDLLFNTAYQVKYNAKKMKKSVPFLYPFNWPSPQVFVDIAFPCVSI